MTRLDETESLWAGGLALIRVLRDRGHEAYLVGGCVRDRLLGRALHDIDIATSALPEEVTAAFSRTIPTGIKHGTVTVLEAGRPFEVTTFRTESGYSDARRPDQVAFVRDLREDLSRRDFTINALAVGVDGEVEDPFDGRKDLTEGRIRCVGHPDIRFGEDALRMLRGIRFAAEFRFAVTLSVWRGIYRQSGRLGLVAMERVGSEWDKMMAGSDPDRACRMLGRSGLLSGVKEPLPQPILAWASTSQTGVWRQDLRCLRDIADTDVRWAAWLAVTGAAAEEAGRLFRTLRFSGKRETRVAAAVAFDRLMAGARDRSCFVTAVLETGRSAARDWLDMLATDEPYRRWLAELKVASVGELAVRGDELAARLEKPAGPWVAKLLRDLLAEVAHGRVPNEQERLLLAAEMWAAGIDGQK